MWRREKIGDRRVRKCVTLECVFVFFFEENKACGKEMRYVRRKKVTSFYNKKINYNKKKKKKQLKNPKLFYKRG